ncbi:hypothetical protein GJ496_000687 [Pomphorhynchus laevis]|nr:hypothetical protein GJ496_000687 [Pomphorhynchus laevis]
MPLITNSLYFYMQETEEKCFIEEIPEDTLIIGSYDIEIMNDNTKQFVKANNKIGVHVHIMDPEDHDILNALYTSKGKFTFTSHTAGEHTICLKSNSTAWFGGNTLKVHLNIDVGEHAQDYQEIGTANRLTELQIRVKQLIDQSDQIAKEQEYHKERERKYRIKAASINSEILYWGVAQLFVVIVTGLLQTRHLRRFFEAKKLV